MRNFRKNLLFVFICNVFVLSSFQVAAQDDAKLAGHEVETKLRLVHIDRDFEDNEDDRDQTGVGLQINYTSPQFGDLVGVGLSGWFAEDISDSGPVRTDILPAENGELEGFSLLGQAYLNFTPTEDFSIKVGRFMHKSMLLTNSGSRAVPASMQGISAKYKLNDQFSFAASYYDKWSRRTSDRFEGFATDESAEGAIDYVGVLSAKYNVNDNIKLEAEYLKSDDYLDKFGLRGSFKQDLSSSSLTYTAGVFTSSDGGDLFVTGAEGGDLDDEDEPGAEVGVTDSKNDGLGGFIEVAWKKDNLKLSGAITKIDEIWIEDNFAGDTGRNPFPTRALGPDFTNTGETAYRLGIIYDWKDHLPGLTTNLSYTRGNDAENSVNPSLGKADEDVLQFRWKYKLPFLKGLQFSGIYEDYNADETGRVDGVKPDQEQLRLYLDYSYTFN